MADQRRGGIAWSDETWNPLRGCSRVSTGCVNCFAERQAIRMAGPGQAYEGLVRRTSQGPKWTGEIRLLQDRLVEPLFWKRPRRVFVNSMADLFHEAVPETFIDRIFAVMARARGHTFQVLTKRAERMHEYMNAPARKSRVLAASMETPLAGMYDCAWPPRNVWLGVSVEDQAASDTRIPLLLDTPAAVRWTSAEPLLSGVSFVVPFDGAKVDGLRGAAPGIPHVDWVVIGGESGPSARPMVLGWAKDIVRQCKAAGVPVFMKQLGARPTNREGEAHPISDRAGKNMDDWPAELRVREWPL